MESLLSVNKPPVLRKGQEGRNPQKKQLRVAFAYVHDKCKFYTSKTPERGVMQPKVADNGQNPTLNPKNTPAGGRTRDPQRDTRA